MSLATTFSMMNEPAVSVVARQLRARLDNMPVTQTVS